MSINLINEDKDLGKSSIFQFDIVNKTNQTCFLRDATINRGKWGIQPEDSIYHTTSSFTVIGSAPKGSVQYYLTYLGAFLLSWDLNYSGKGTVEVTKIDATDLYETSLVTDGNLITLELFQK